MEPKLKQLSASADSCATRSVAFLKKGRELAVAETGTMTWYAFKLSDTTYGIFDTFADEEGRQAHLNGEIPAALGQVAPDLLAQDPDIRLSDILAVK
jgi:quinol monooxygenase YgiN